MTEAIAEGNYVVLMKNFDPGNIKIIPITKGAVVHYGKLHFDPSSLIGAKFGDVFEIKDEKMILVDDFENYNHELSNTVSSKLATFEEKSQFSKEKILKKKKKQNHANVVTAMRPSIMLLCDMLYGRDKVGGLRMDSLSQILTSANIQNGSKTLLLDHNLGLVTGAVMTRSLPDGICVQLIPDNETAATTRKAVNMLNISDEESADKLVSITIRDFYRVCKGLDTFDEDNEVLKTKAKEHIARLSQMNDRVSKDSSTGEKTSVSSGEREEQLRQSLIKKDANREARNRERVAAASYLRNLGLDSIILIAQSDHPLPLLKLSYDFLMPSRQFVIYSDTIEPLLECHEYLKSNLLAVSMHLSETWFRRYQVLPDRTRPEMNTTGYGGYLLSGTKAILKAPICAESSTK